MNLPLQSFSSLMQVMAASVQGAATQLIDLTIGSTLRALLEANASIGLWMQWLIVQVLGVTRAATSNNADLDSFVQDFGVKRLAAQAAAGTLTFSRYTPTLAAIVPASTQVRSTDGALTFLVGIDTTNTAWNAGANGYVLAAGLTSITVPAVATVTGSIGNIQAGGATVLGSAVPGVDQVTNPFAFVGGMDSESDSALRSRFALLMQSRERGTKIAIQAAVAGVRAGISCTVLENMDAGGNTVPGNFLVTIDDGTGAPSSSLTATVAAAVDAVRPVGTISIVRAPQVLTASIACTLGVSDPTQHAAVSAIVAALLGAYVDGLPVGATLAWSRLVQVAYDASPLVTNVTGLTINLGTADVVPPAYAVIKAGSVAVS